MFRYVSGKSSLFCAAAVGASNITSYRMLFENGAADDEGQLEGGDGTTDMFDVEEIWDRGDEYEYGCGGGCCCCSILYGINGDDVGLGKKSGDEVAI